jgi:sulfofructose kinase
MTRILITGIAVHDIVFKVGVMPRDQGKHYASAREEVVGGIAANASISVARLGGEAHIATCLGRDFTGRAIADALAADGVHNDGIEWTDCQSSLSAILVDDDGERLLINHADSLLFEREARLIEAWSGPLDAVMTDTRWRRGALATLDLARRRGLPGLVDFDRVPEDGGLEIVRAATHVVFGEAGLQLFSGIDDLVEALRWAAKQTRAFVAVTAGSRGTLWHDGSEIRSMPAFEVAAVDTLGAGDVFHGAFALALGEGQGIEQGLRFASAAAALKCLTFGGGRGAPTRAELERFIGERS